MSQGLIKTTHHNYLAKSERGSVEFTEVGVNFTQSLSERLRLGVQLFSRDLGPIGNYSPHFDWYYLDYRFSDWLGVRAGRLKLPWGLYNESQDVDAGRVPVLLPQSLYSVASREFLFAQTGSEIYGLVPLADAGRLQYRLYGGTIFLNAEETSAQLREFDVPYVVGGRLMWQPPIEGLQLGGSIQKLRLEFDFVPTAKQLADYQSKEQLPADFSGVISTRIPAWLWIASIEYQAHALLLAAEYGRSYLEIQTNLIRPTMQRTREGFYLMASYQVGSWFTPGLYYSAHFPNITQSRKGRANYQHDLAVTFRYDLTPNWLLKLEGHYMHGTAGLQANLNPSQSRHPMTEDWGVFLAKTTAYF